MLKIIKIIKNIYYYPFKCHHPIKKNIGISNFELTKIKIKNTISVCFKRIQN